MQQHDARQRAPYYAEIIAIVSGIELTSPYITHDGKVNKQNQGKVSGSFHNYS